MTPPIVPLKRLVDPTRPITYGIVQAGPDTPDGIPYIRPIDMTPYNGILNPESLQRTTPEIAHNYQRSTVATGDLVVSIGPSYGKIMIVPHNLAGANLTQGTARVAPAPGTSARYLYWALQSATSVQFWNSSVGGATFRALNLEPLGRTPIPLITIDEQRRIADFLDAETAYVDALLASAQRGRKLLDERRWSTEFALATGANRPGPHSDPGLGWVTCTPVDWPVVPLKFVACLGSGHTPSRSHPEYWEDCTIPWISLFDVGKMRDVRQERLAETTQKISELGMANSSACLHPAGTVVLSRTASVGFSTIMAADMAVSQHFVTWTCSDKISPEYLLHTLRAMRQYFESVQVGTTNVTVFMPDLQSIKIPLPPIHEQKLIVDQIVSATKKIDALTGALDKQLALLRERRNAVITAAITGQFDVSTASGRGVTEGIS